MKAPRRTAGLAFTLIELIVIVAVTAIILLLFLPALRAPRQRAKKINCVNNLKQVGLAFRMWSGDNGDKMPMEVSVTNGGTKEWIASGQVFPHFQVMSNELNTPKILVCPGDGERSPATNFTSDFCDSRISYFAGLDADETTPDILLAGDRNLTVFGKTFRGLMSLRTNDPAGWTGLIHTNQGNIAFADGSVRQVDSRRLREILVRSGVTNRLVFP